jgi:RNA polymerase sigma-70 factor (ECF subfamily)
MSAEAPQDITALLEAWGNGDEAALNRLMPLVYPELRRIARQHLNHRRSGHTLESAGLANEAYLKLVRGDGLRCENRTHFLALCSQMIRRILVDYARNRGYAKRGGNALRVPLDEVTIADKMHGVEVLALDAALASLYKVDPRKSRVVELRYFGGLSVVEAAQVLSISAETANRDWQVAKAWLHRELSGSASS